MNRINIIKCVNKREFKRPYVIVKFTVNTTKKKICYNTYNAVWFTGCRGTHFNTGNTCDILAKKCVGQNVL